MKRQIHCKKLKKEERKMKKRKLSLKTEGGKPKLEKRNELDPRRRENTQA